MSSDHRTVNRRSIPKPMKKSEFELQHLDDFASNGSATAHATALDDSETEKLDIQSGPVPATSSTLAVRSNDLAWILSLLDWPLILTLVYGGCCSNAWTLEYLLLHSKSIGTALTFTQMSFISIQGLPSFVVLSSSFPFISFKEREVPLSRWALQVFVLWTMTLLNNWAFAYDVPLTLQIVFRSGGLAVSMLFGWVFLSRKYGVLQVFSMVLITSGVILTTMSRPTSSSKVTNTTDQAHTADPQVYSIGIALLTASLLLTGYLGMLQELTYKKYGPCWQEGLFYTHFLSIPLFIPLIPSIRAGLSSLSETLPNAETHSFSLAYTTLPLNLITQLSCVAGVNMLTTRLSSVSTNLILTSRKALSLCISVWWFGSAWNEGMTLGSTMVFAGTIVYAWAAQYMR